MDGWQRSVVRAIAPRFPNAVFYKPTTAPVVALTIDDVPIPEVPYPCPTRLILAAIAAHNRTLAATEPPAQATFFVIGSHLNSDTTLLGDLIAQGHELGNHGWTDCWSALQAPERFAHELQQTHKAIQAQAPGAKLRWYRPGRGLYTPAMVSVLAKMPGYESSMVLASMLPLDTMPVTANPDFIARYLIQHCFPGAILVLHGGSLARTRNTVQVLERILPTLQQQGYRIATLTGLWQGEPPSAALTQISQG